ncbi:hypothetical protein GGX14DRAFT_403318 [Mycena pura]|uniref:Uncharacterized protein n=1 Tax=Mycena pura TaxID=153505 RepID=A0AAD6Y6E5_9AGAR|nr:hypothetical protein GGX14DRAFT_403318 [Mycena pura]
MASGIVTRASGIPTSYEAINILMATKCVINFGPKNAIWTCYGLPSASVYRRSYLRDCEDKPYLYLTLDTGGISLDEIVNKDGSISCRNAFKRKRIQGYEHYSSADWLTDVIGSGKKPSEDAGSPDGPDDDAGGLLFSMYKHILYQQNYEACSGLGPSAPSSPPSPSMLVPEAPKGHGHRRHRAIVAIKAIVTIVTTDADAGGTEGTGGCSVWSGFMPVKIMKHARAIVAIVAIVTINADARGAEGRHRQKLLRARAIVAIVAIVTINAMPEAPKAPEGAKFIIQDSKKNS